MAEDVICCSSYFVQYLPMVIWDERGPGCLCPACQFCLANVREVQFRFGSGPPNLVGGDPAQCRGLTHDITRVTPHKCMWSMIPQKRAPYHMCLTIVGFERQEIVFVVGNLGKAWWNIYKAAPICHVKESTTQISGWNEPLETDTRRTKNIFSRYMNPSPIFQRLSADPSIGYPWDSVMSDNGWGFSTRCKPTVIASRYWFTFLAISYASLLRVIRVRFFVQPKVETCGPGQHATT